VFSELLFLKDNFDPVLRSYGYLLQFIPDSDGGGSVSAFGEKEGRARPLE
jgi:hypothetical protein